MQVTFQRIQSECRLVASAMQIRLGLVNLLCALLPRFTLTTVRAACYRAIGFRIAPRVAFFGPMSVTGGGSGVYQRLSIGSGAMIGVDCLFNLEAPITIGSHVFVSHRVRIYTSKHAIGPSSQRFAPGFSRLPVIIGDGALIGVNAIILPGVNVGRGSVVAAGSVVREDVPPDTLVSGVPAVVVRPLPVE
jgi:acetyltransferase-like isoleucine patch superfamily enzyme